MLGGGTFGSNLGQQSTGGLFGQSTTFGSGLGQPAGASIGQNTSGITQPSSAGLFNSSTSVFGGGASNTSLFGNNNPSNIGFGQVNTSSTFGQPSTGLFGQSVGSFGNTTPATSQPSIFGAPSAVNTATSGIFGSSTPSTNLFGSFQNSFGTSTGFGSQNQQQSQQSSTTGFFGQPSNTNASIFGSSTTQTFGNSNTSPFGGSLTQNSSVFGTEKRGTKGITFQPVVDSDSQARIMSIVYQKDIDQKKSVEEIRWEDYQEKRGPPGSISSVETTTSTPLTSTSPFSMNTFGTSNSGGFFGSTTGTTTTTNNSIFGQPTTGSLGSTGMATSGSLFGSSAQTTNSTGIFGGSSLFGSAGLNTQNTTQGFGMSTTPATANSGLFSSSLGTTNSGGLLGTSTSNTGLFGQPTISTSNSGLFAQTTTTSSFGDFSNSLSNKLTGTSNSFGQTTTGIGSTSSFGTGILQNQGNTFGTANTGLGTSLFSQPNSSGLSTGNNLLQTSGSSNNSSLTTNLFGSTQPVGTGLFGNTSTSSGFTFGNIGTNSQPLASNLGISGLSNTNSGLSGQTTLNPSQPSLGSSIGQTSLFGSQNTLSSTPSLFNNTSLTNMTNSNLFGMTNNTSSQNQNSLGLPTLRTISNSQLTTMNSTINSINSTSSISLNKLNSQNNFSLQNSSDRNKSLWLWKPLPQCITRSGKYRFESSPQTHSNEGSNTYQNRINLELALPALAAESAKHTNSLLTSVRRVERGADSQTPATFLNLLERQQQFYDAIQSPEGTNSPISNTQKSMVFSTVHRTSQPHFSSIDEAFEDAVDDANLVKSPRQLRNISDREPTSVSGLLNLESISRMSKDIQFSKDHTRTSIGRASIESIGSSRTPHIAAPRISGTNSMSSERPIRTSIGLTTPRPILRKAEVSKYDITGTSNTTLNLIEQKESYSRREQFIASLTPILTKPSYYCIPSIEALSTFTEDRLAAVEDFRVIREGVGEIMWPGLTDLRGLNLDHIISIEPLCVSVYGEDDSTIPVGEGLNKKAIILLKNCKPKNISTSGNIEEFNAKRISQIKSYTEQMGATFISLDTVTWDWRFEVVHFSRYKFPDIESFENQEPQRNLNELSKDMIFPNNITKSPTSSNNEELVQSVKINNIESKKATLQSNRQKILQTGNNQLTSLYFQLTKDCHKFGSRCLLSLNTVSSRSSINISSNGIIVIPHCTNNRSKYSICSSRTLVTFYKLSIINMNPQNQTINMGTTKCNLNEIQKLKKNYLNNKNIPKRIIRAWLKVYFNLIGDRETTISNGTVSLHTLIKLTFLLWNISKQELMISEHLRDHEDIYYLASYTEETLCLLCSLLFFHIKSEISSSNSQTPNQTSQMIFEFVSWWLQKVNSKLNKDFNKDYKPKTNTLSDYVNNIMLNMMKYISSGLIPEGILESINDMGSLILPRLTALCAANGYGVNINISQAVADTLLWWKYTGLEISISDTTLLLTKLLAGYIDPSVASIAFNWRIIFGMLLWHPPVSENKILESNNGLVYNAMEAYELNMDGKFSFLTSKNSNKQKITYVSHQIAKQDQSPYRYHSDLQFWLLKFFSFLDYNQTQQEADQCIPKLSNIFESNSNMLSMDFSLVWIVSNILDMYLQISRRNQYIEDISSNYMNKLHLNFIQQLEFIGLWEWSLFVALHLQKTTDTSIYSHIFHDILLRNIPNSFPIHSEFSEEKFENLHLWKFLIKTLGLPKTWLLETLSWNFAYNGNFEAAASSLLLLYKTYYKSDEYNSEGNILLFSRFINNSVNSQSEIIINVVEYLFDIHVLPKLLMELSTIYSTELKEQGNKHLQYANLSNNQNIVKLLLQTYSYFEDIHNPDCTIYTRWNICKLLVETTICFLKIIGLCDLNTSENCEINKSTTAQVKENLTQILHKQFEVPPLLESTLLYVINHDCWRLMNSLLDNY
ncbi:nucleoporin autopeptidase family protein [Cryptosporidium muris RN66]|uniref:Nucleoporin autopeptidase family protein n=1 Tax=Cryptosporidium muris (strain RN66) TaxID=441375 RepID=B6AGA0_CRYMR|nr:nucleoporin autopeptidase family protein [Cryptosporidium muris RN66]EEA07241.1 nucleoporin autopeptidase family protein [Cryptosporidium muris RN66]|eukprot:XP_002141590.1 nucleoporin autopeptidase family protein [Cryptosporidium muris RN66]